MSTFQKTFTRISDMVDPETGEVLSTAVEKEIQEFKKVSNADEFIQVYLDSLAPLLNLSNITEYKLLMLL